MAGGFLDYVAGVVDFFNDEENAGLAGLASLLGGAALNSFGITDANIPSVGYQGGIPEYTGVRERVQDTYDPSRRPGSGGQRYFSDMEYAAPGQEASAQQRAIQQALNLKAQNMANMARQTRQYGAPPQPQPQMPPPVMGAPPSQVGTTMPAPTEFTGLAGYAPTYRQGGIAALAGGGPASAYNRRYNGYYLGGTTDGMGDKVPARIDGVQEARLSDGEFVVPADVVSHLGNGNSNAGAEPLYSMMDRVRQARTGSKQQGKEINPRKFMPDR